MALTHLAGQLDLERAGIPVYFKETPEGKYMRRSILADRGPYLSGRLSDRHLYDARNIIQGNSDAGNVWAKGFYADGTETAHRIIDLVRREVEECDCFQGFQMTHSIGRVGITSAFGFPSQVNGDLRRLYMNMVPLSPSLSYLSVGSVPKPQIPTTTTSSSSIPPDELVRHMFDPDNMMTSLYQFGGRRNPRSLAFGAHFCGKNSMRAVEAEMRILQQSGQSRSGNTSRTDSMHDWTISHNHSQGHTYTSFCPVPTHGFETSCAYFGNFTSIRHTFSTILDRFDGLYSRRSFVHFYTSEGMDKMEFVEARELLCDLVERYKEVEAEFRSGDGGL
ncbi:hypothetical protein AJ80_07815 [Polytolypa hystricis UAMH7299]|uniref:Tubulin/FtsZ GTPase domain-containing protein n=1 Tax=Polytolypa hystricis (strain UAMH7299) TaxID=1447883 RepID=A0A2B7XAM1_POLH7|nr:hypothetical protein AJ80_07815 [Polytolypa hystricis UAMH7299]